MGTRDKNLSPRNPADTSFALGLLTAIVYVTGFAMVAAWFALLIIGQPVTAPAPQSPTTCGICGVVERVGEFERASLRISGEPSEGFVVMLAALSGSLPRATAPGKFYETAVLHDDGSVRIVRDDSAPQWKRGDRVKVIRGRIEPGEALRMPAAGVRAASQTEKTPTPVRPVARVQ